MLSTSAALRRALLLLLAAASQRLALVSADEEEPEPEPEDECRIPPDLTREQRCEYVESTEACDEIAEVIDYLEIYYCSDVSQGVANFLLLCFALWWCLLIVVLGTTADEYFCPPLTAMARWLRLRPRVAAVTLLALANGAPDIFSVQAALAAGETKVAVGALIGGTLFVTCLVVPAVIWCSRERVRAGGMLFRDVGVFFVTVGLLAFGAQFAPSVRLWMPLLLLGLYVCYVAAVAVSHKLQPMLAADRILKYNDQSAILKKSLVPSERTSRRGSHSSEGLGRRSSATDDLFNKYARPATDAAAAAAAAGSASHASFTDVDVDEPSSSRDSGVSPRRPSLVESDSTAAAWQRYHGAADGSLHRQWLELVEWEERSGTVARVLWAVELPFRLARACTIPTFVLQPPDASAGVTGGLQPRVSVLAQCSKVISGLGFPVLLCVWLQREALGDDDLELTVGPLPLPLLVLLCAVPHTLALAVWRVLAEVERRRRSSSSVRAGGAPSTVPRWLHRLYMTGALIGAVVWIDLVSGEVVALLLSFGTILDVPTPLLAQTALAWGNSVGDSFANAALARQGETKMAITGCLAAPIFNVLGGFGASLLVEVVAADDGSFDTGLQFDALLGNALAFQGGALLLLLVVGAASQFFLGKGVALALVAIYLTFLTLCFLIGFGVIDA